MHLSDPNFVCIPKPKEAMVQTVKNNMHRHVMDPTSAQIKDVKDPRSQDSAFLETLVEAKDLVHHLITYNFYHI